MLNIKKILVPIDFPNPSLSVIHQAATLARRFHSEILMLHIVTPASRKAGMPEEGPELTRWDMRAEIIKADLNQTLARELDGLTIQCVLAKGNPALAIVRTAQQEKADLIMMPSRGHTFNEFLLGSVTAIVTQGAECPVWTGAHVDELPVQKFAIRNVLCAVNFRAHSNKTASWAEQVAAEFGARLTLADVTAPVEFWGAGGSYVNLKWKAALVADASQHIAKVQRGIGIKADIFIGSGDVPKVLSQAAKQTRADLLVTGCRPYGGHLRTHGYSIIRELPIPVLSVGGP